MHSLASRQRGTVSTDSRVDRPMCFRSCVCYAHRADSTGANPQATQCGGFSVSALIFIKAQVARCDTLAPWTCILGLTSSRSSYLDCTAYSLPPRFWLTEACRWKSPWRCSPAVFTNLTEGPRMTDTTRPTKETVREYLERRTHAQLDPPPTTDEIRRQLGWHLLPPSRQPDRDERD